MPRETFSMFERSKDLVHRPKLSDVLVLLFSISLPGDIQLKAVVNSMKYIFFYHTARMTKWLFNQKRLCVVITGVQCRTTAIKSKCAKILESHKQTIIKKKGLT